MTWYKKWFGREYIDLYTHRGEKEAREFISTLEESLSLKPGKRILDLCCGTGRYALLLADRGFDVVGLDLSTRLIHYAEQKAKEMGVCVQFIVRDMREIPYSDYFDGIMNMFTSFGYFGPDKENERVIAAASRALKRDGWMVIDFLNRDYIINNFLPYDQQQKGSITIRQHRTLNEETNRIEKVITLIKDGSYKKYKESVKLYSPEELKSLFQKHGLQPTNTFGDYNGEQFTPSSPRFIVIGRKI